MSRIALALVLVLAIGHGARAHPIAIADETPQPEPRNLFGFHLGLGMLPLDHEKLGTYSIGMGIEHPVFERWRVFADYEWLWLERSHTATMAGVHGDGQRASLGVRRTLAAKQAWPELRLWVDGELGGAFALVDDDVAGVHALPEALAGLRAGYDLAGHRRSESRLLRFEIDVRALAIPGGAGVAAGVGALWN